MLLTTYHLLLFICYLLLFVTTCYLLHYLLQNTCNFLLSICYLFSGLFLSKLQRQPNFALSDHKPPGIVVKLQLWLQLQLVTSTTTVTITFNLTELGSAQPQLVFSSSGISMYSRMTLSDKKKLIHCNHPVFNLCYESLYFSSLSFVSENLSSWLISTCLLPRCTFNSEGRESRSCLGLETEGTETFCLVSVLYKIFQFSCLGLVSDEIILNSPVLLASILLSLVSVSYKIVMKWWS